MPSPTPCSARRGSQTSARSIRRRRGYRGADSLALLTGAYAQVRAAGYALVNADCVVIGQDPRVAPHREEMRRRLAAALGVEEGAVNVRATTTDRLGFTGRGEGLAAEAVALLRVEP